MRRVWCLCICVCAISCGRNEYGDHPPHPVTGRVLVNGQPAEGADVILYHAGDWGEKTIIPMARTDENGTFELSTYGMADGAPIGDFQVEIIWAAYRHGRDVGPDKLGGKYAKRATSGLKATIAANTTALPDFELTADPSKLKGSRPFRPLSKQEELNKRRKDR
jgi:hypothetical protein